jgi:NTP pyrophosphatase (non-canonical NTP hydrolase)
MMTVEQYQKSARRTQNPDMGIKDRLYHAGLGLTSEAGEAAGILQKEYQGHEFDRSHMVKELGDCLWMIAEACDALGVTMGKVMEINIEKLRSRYPDGFAAEKSLHRKKGDI